MLENLSSKMDEYMPLRDVVFKTIRQGILRGELIPGERLMEIALAQKLGVSRTPIREAIRMLELEGLVVMAPRKGAVVAGITEKNLRDVLEVRKALEELAIELGCRRMDQEEVHSLGSAQEKFKTAVESGDIMQIAGADEAFHDIIFSGTRNERLVQLLNNLREQMYRYRLEYVKDEKTRNLLISEHEAIIEAIRTGSIEDAKRNMRVHIENQEKAILKSIALKKDKIKEVR